MGGLVSGITDTIGDVASAAAPYAGLIGVATGNPLLGAGIGALGSAMGGNAQAAGANVGALGSLMGGQSALQANQQVSQTGQFRPIGTTTRFGASNFQFDPSGRLTGAGYTLSPEAQAYQNQLSGMTGQGLTQGQQLQGLASQYLGESPDAVRQRYVQQQTALVAPEQEQQLAGIRNRLFQTGRGGLATGATTAGGLMATNPEMAAYYNAVAKQQAQIAAGADTAAQNQIKFGQGLAAGAYEPFNAGFGALSTVEKAGQQSLGLGSELGGQASSAARALAPYTYEAAAYNPTANLLANPQLQNAIGSGLSGLFGGGSTYTGSPGGLNISNIDYSGLSNIYSGGNPFTGVLGAGETWYGE